MDYSANDFHHHGLRRRSVQPLIAAQDLPDIKVGRRRQSVEHPLPRVAVPVREMRREDAANPGTVAGATAIEAVLQLRITELIGELADQKITDRFIDVEHRADERRRVAGGRGPPANVLVRQDVQRGGHQPGPAAVRSQHGLHGGPGPVGDLLEGKIFDRVREVECDRALPDAFPRGVRLGGAVGHIVGAVGRFHESSINTKFDLVSIGLSPNFQRR